MAQCGTAELLKLISNKTLNPNTRVRFNVRTDLPDCKKIDAKNFTAVSGNVHYNSYARPANRFECGRTGCITTGTLTMAVVDETATYRALYDATEFAAGVVTFYVKPDAGVTYPITTTVKISDKDDFVNADVYTVNLTADMVGADGYIPVLVDLSQTPASQEGTGWNATQTGAYIQLASNQIVGYSSISIYDSLMDFETNAVVEVGCLSTVGGTYDVEMVTAACQDAQLNSDVQTLTFPMTGTQVTPNYNLLNPMQGKGKNTTGFRNATTKKTIEADGTVIIPDANQDICGYITAQIADSCDATNAMLTILSVPTPVDVDEGHFQAIPNQDGTTTLRFNQSLSGMDVLITYPQKVEIKETVLNPDNLNSVHVSMSVPMTTSDGHEYVLVYDNVFVTSFPATITNEAAEFAFTITIARDADGNFMRRQEIIG